MNVLISGASGMVGSALATSLAADGQRVRRLVRTRSSSPDDVSWDPAAGTIDSARLPGSDAVVHLAGESIAGGRWTREKKQRIRESRVAGTRLLAQSLSEMDAPPQVLVCASAIGYYGDRGDEELTESSPPGSGFLAEVCRDWESAADPARAAGIRVVHLRIGVILSRQGGALQKMLLPFKLGAGGIVGSGRQYWSWVALDDIVGMIRFAIDEPLEGPVNGTAPAPATNRDFTKTLGRVLGRPTVLPMPAFAARLALGEMADELLLSSARVRPERLQQAGYPFRHPTLEGALRAALDG